MKTTYLGLLRGINVGGKNRLPMKDLRELVTSLDCDDVVTYIQSGNVIFKADPAEVVNLAERIETRIFERFALKTPVILRSVEALQSVIDDNPFLKNGADEAFLHVMFLKSEPGPERVANLDPNRSPGDSYLVRGREVFLHLPRNVADTKLINAYFDSKLATISTGRNWRTVNMLWNLMKS